MTQLLDALAFYYDHRAEFDAREREAELARESGEARTLEELRRNTSGVRSPDDLVD